MTSPHTRQSFRTVLTPALAASAFVATTMLASWSPAAVLLLDFGSGATYTGTNDPAHLDGKVDLSYTDWRRVAADPVDTTDSAGNAISVNSGRSQAGAATNNTLDLDFGVDYVNSTSGSGIFGTALTSDAIRDANYVARDPVGAFITGLPTGEYYVYVIAHYAGSPTVGAEGKTLQVWADPTAVVGGNGNSGGTAEFANVATFTHHDQLEGTNTATWEQGNNYARFAINLTTAAPNLIVAVESGTVSDVNGTISAIMVAPVPEPATMSVLASGLFVTGARRRRQQT